MLTITRRTATLLAVQLLLAGLFLAAGKAEASTGDVLTVKSLTPTLTVLPGAPVTLTCELQNTTRRALALTPQLELPSGWDVLLPPSAFTLAAGEKRIFIFPIKVPHSARSGLYRVRLSLAGRDSAEPVAVDFFVQVLSNAREPLEVKALHPRLTIAPGEPVTLACELHNTTAKPLALTVAVQAPAGWQVMIPLDELTLGPQESQILLLPILVPAEARAGGHRVRPIFAGADLAAPVAVEFSLAVTEIRGLSLQLAEAPPYVVAEPFAVTFIAWNKGNTVLNLTFNARNINGFKLSVAPPDARLAAGEKLEVEVDVEVPANLAKQVTGLIQLAALCDDGVTQAAASAKVDILPRTGSNKEAFVWFPLKLEVGGDLDEDSAFYWRLTGKGSLREDGTDTLQLEISDTTRVLSYARPDLHLVVGDQLFRLSPLTEWDESAEGLTFQTWSGDWSWLFTRYGDEEKRTGVSVEYGLNPGTDLALNYVAQSELASDLWSVRGHFQPFTSVKMELEYGRQSEADGIRLAGNYAQGPWAVNAAWRHTQPDYHGEEHETTDLDLEGTLRLAGSYTVRFALDDRREVDAVGAEVERRWRANLELQGRRGGSRWSVQYIEQDIMDEDDDLDYHARDLSLSLHSALVRKHRVYQRLRLTSQYYDLTSTEIDYLTYYLSCQQILPHGSLTAYLDTDLPWPDRTGEEIGLGLTGTWHWGPYRLWVSLVFDDLSEDDYELSTTIRRNWSNGAALTLRLEGGWSSDAETGYGMELRFIAPLGIRLGRRSTIGGLSGRILDENGRGVAGLVLQLDAATAVTDAAGRYEFPVILPGVYCLTARAGSLEADRLTVPALPWRFEIGPGEQKKQDFILCRAAIVRGRIKVAALTRPDLASGAIAGEGYNQPRPDLATGIVVELIRGEERYQCLSGQEGEFVFEHLHPGQWRLVVYLDGLSEFYEIRPAELLLELREGQDLAVEFEIVPLLREIEFVEGGEVQNVPSP